MTSSGWGEDRSQVTRPIGQDEGGTGHVAARADPSLAASAPEAFAVTVFVRTAAATTVDIARIDTGHDGVHFDRPYLPRSHQRRRDYGVDVVDYRGALRLLLANWRDYLEAYEANHGLPD